VPRDEPSSNLPLDGNGNIGIDTIVKLLSNAEVHSNPTKLAPTEGRVVEDANDGTIYIADGDNWLDVNSQTGYTTPVLNTDDASPKRVADNWHYAGSYDGSDPDARLDNALAAANRGDRIYLESANYGSDRTISDWYVLMGTANTTLGSGPSLTWTVDSFRVQMYGLNAGSELTLNINSGTIHINGGRWGSGTDINVNTSGNRIIGIRGGDVVFASGTSGNVIDGCVETAVTDNDGSNVVGDIA
jgi:hypothetical protein